jgi:GH15 family glucan-1,4-alpha-glucosidase
MIADEGTSAQAGDGNGGPGPAGMLGGFPRIADYGFLSDCHTSALVGPDGSVEWLCLPRFDSPSVFSSILDRDAGFFRFAPQQRVPVARRYVPGTNVLETTWSTTRGWLVVRDALTIGEWRGDEAVDPHLRVPHDQDAEHMLVRTARCVQGEVELDLVVNLLFDYGSRSPQWTLSSDRHLAEVDLDGLRARLITDLNMGIEANRLAARHTLGEGEACFCALAWGDGEIPTDFADAERRLDATEEYWRTWLEDGDFPDHPWRVYLQRSALVLRGLIHAPTGATVAAATTSLPESVGGERNWDYRYTWIRDASFTLWGLHVLGLDDEAIDFMAFVAEVCREQGPDLQIMYGIGGEKELTERTLDHLSGYQGSAPVRIGNAAHTQQQNDVYGALLDGLYIHTKAHRRVPAILWPLVQMAVERASQVWREPDQGIWEARGEPKHYVSSKLLCWVALDRGRRLAAWRDEDELAERWGNTAEKIRAEILERGVSERGVFRQHYDTDALDASILLAPLMRFLPPDDERLRATVLAIADELTSDGLVLRYRVEETDDGLRGVEGTFTICSFWLVSALSEIGERRRACELCERLLSFAGPLGLYAEEIEPRTATHLGNFPQAFTHLALINAVSHVIADEAYPDRTGPSAVFTEMRERG